jgi:HEAT repeat protein
MAARSRKIDSLIADLDSKNDEVRIGARRSLVSLGQPALRPLVEALQNPKETVRWEATRALAQMEGVWRQYADGTTVNILINDLDSKDGIVRTQARQLLTDIGASAVKPLIKALSHKKETVRWEAAKALSQIGDSSATAALVKALDDKMFDVRWLAAEGLIVIGRPALVPLLKRLMAKPRSMVLREGAHRVLHNTEGGHLNKTIQPVLLAIEGVEPAIEVPVAAEAALTELAKDAKGKSA